MDTNSKYISHLISESVHSIDPEADVVLFGSRARGDNRIDSDWDILILTQYPVDKSLEQKFRDKLYNIELETGEPFSIFIYSKEEWNTKQKITPFYENVNQEGIPLSWRNEE